jgi:hypothetical protein
MVSAARLALNNATVGGNEQNAQANAQAPRVILGLRFTEKLTTPLLFRRTNCFAAMLDRNAACCATREGGIFAADL